MGQISNIYLSAPNPPRVIDKISAVFHLYPSVQLHSSRLLNLENNVGFQIQILEVLDFTF